LDFIQHFSTLNLSSYLNRLLDSVSDPTATTAATTATDNQCQTDYLTVRDSISMEDKLSLEEKVVTNPRANNLIIDELRSKEIKWNFVLLIFEGPDIKTV